jgi:hypothetical protein
MQATITKIIPYSSAWEKKANQLARSYAPYIYPCGKCDGPVMDGYCCTTCGDTNPRVKGVTDESGTK